jgi:pimeloyl-ACP methyl ester carboxylesterase
MEDGFEKTFVGTGDAQREIAMLRREGRTPGLFWLGGFRSDMEGTKAIALDDLGAGQGLAVTRFDYSGHGRSGGDFLHGTISRWLEEALAVFATTQGPQIVVGSSMGGWIMLLATLARPGRVAGLIGLAAAPDFTEALMWQRFPPDVRSMIEREGVYHRPTEYGDTPYPITRALIEDGDKHLFGSGPVEVGCLAACVHAVREHADVERDPAQPAFDRNARVVEDVGEEDE